MQQHVLTAVRHPVAALTGRPTRQSLARVMHVSADRFDLSTTDDSRLDDFRDYFFFNSEYCSECFTRIREIERLDYGLSERSTANRPNCYHERTSQATVARTGFEAPSERYGITFCDNCGSESGSRWARTRSLDELTTSIYNLVEATADDTPYSIDWRRFVREVHDLKTGSDARDRQGRDLQCLAVAWSRAVNPR